MKWKWGYWKHRGDIECPTGNGHVYYPYHEFVAPGDVASEEGLVLSSADFGTVATTDEARRLDIIRSESCGHGGETGIEISEEHMRIISEACNEYLRKP